MKQLSTFTGIFILAPIIGIILWVIIFFLIFTGLNVCQAKEFIRPSPINPTKQVISKENGYIKQSAIDPRVFIQYDKKGKIKGIWKKSPADKRKLIFRKAR